MRCSGTEFAVLAAIAGVTFIRAAAGSQPLNNGEYAIHEDGGIIYNPLSRDAQKKGLLEKFKGVPKKTGMLEMGDLTLRYEAPLEADAYDVVPVKYVLENRKPKAGYPIAVECTAFEDRARDGGRPLYDMSLPGDLSVNIEYVGHVSADRLPTRKLLDPRNPDPEIEDGVPWKSDPPMRSGVIRKADY
ncbi:MAG: hypothetical protein FJ280_27145, partial [Planctomycetes bacterium]|nr:hypothetical protein [Planctomycetota bacterium]